MKIKATLVIEFETATEEDQISREDMAKAVLDSIQDPRWRKGPFAIAGGDDFVEIFMTNPDANEVYLQILEE